MVEIKGHEEKKGEQRIKGVEHNASKNRLTCREGKTREEKLLGYDKQPYCLIIGGGQGGIVLAPIETIRRSHYHY
jgi:putative flavoprotein involved in K+ transport